VATTGEGAGEVWEAIEAHRRHLTDTGGLEARRAQRLRDEVDQIVVETLRARARAGAHDDLDDVHQAVADRRLDPWAEMIMPETAVPLAMYEHPFFGRFPALTRNSFGHGTLTYEGTVLSDDLQDKVIAEVLRLAGLSSEDQELPSAIHVKHGTGNNGRNLHYYMNFSPSEQTFRYAHASGVDLLTDRKISQAKSLTLAPWDLVIIEESR
jgi:beta-galactosidase